MILLALLSVAVASPRWGVELGPQVGLLPPVGVELDAEPLQRRTANVALRGSVAWPVGGGRVSLVAAVDGGLWNRNWVWRDEVASATELRGEATVGVRSALGPGRLGAEGEGAVPFVEAGAGAGLAGRMGDYAPAVGAGPVYPAASLGLGLALAPRPLRPLVVARARGGLLRNEGLKDACAAPCSEVALHPGGVGIELLIGALWP